MKILLILVFGISLVQSAHGANDEKCDLSNYDLEIFNESTEGVQRQFLVKASNLIIDFCKDSSASNSFKKKLGIENKSGKKRGLDALVSTVEVVAPFLKGKKAVNGPEIFEHITQSLRPIYANEKTELGKKKMRNRWAMLNLTTIEIFNYSVHRDREGQ